MTRQTGQVLATPTRRRMGAKSPLSDSGGHGNLWVMSTERAATANHLRERLGRNRRRTGVVARREVHRIRRLARADGRA
jgi:hypothetical protein